MDFGRFWIRLGFDLYRSYLVGSLASTLLFAAYTLLFTGGWEKVRPFLATTPIDVLIVQNYFPATLRWPR